MRLTDACPTKLIRSEYELLDPTCCQTLGHGASSTVRLAYHRLTGRPVAVKTIAKHDALGLCSQNRCRSGARRMPRLEEVDVLVLLKGCDNVIQLLNVYETNTEVHLVLEYCEGGDLFECIKKRRQRRLLDPSLTLNGPVCFLEKDAAIVARTLLDVLKKMHERHCVHRDVKPEVSLPNCFSQLLSFCSSAYGPYFLQNILLVKPDDGSTLDVKLTDFGLARILKNKEDDDESYLDASESNASSDQGLIERRQRSRAYSCVGSDFYTAPEVSVGLGYDTPVDIYSLGVTVYVMLCGAPPSISQFNNALFKIEDDDRSSSISTRDSSSDSDESGPTAITAKDDLFPPELNISDLAQDFICKLIHPDPDKRLRASDALNHEWITQLTDDTASVCKSASESALCLTARSMSITKAEALIKLPIQGSIHEIAPPVLPPANSPKLSPMPSPLPTPPPVNATLLSVCSKLVPLQEKQNRREHRRHKSSPRKHSRGADDGAKTVTLMSTPPKKVRTEEHHKPTNA